jgi:cell division protein FtsN
MGYQFSFTKLRFFLILFMVLLAAVLIFVGGVAIGKRIAPSDDEAVDELPSGSKLNAKKLASAKSLVKVPAIPVLPGEAAPKATAPATAAAAPPVTTPPAESPQPVAGQTASAAPAAAPEATPPVHVAVAVAAANPADNPFVLQVGAFRDTKPAKDLQADLLKKGYSTTIYNMVDEDLRSWHMVRFGGYKDVSTASKAASNFTAKEGVQALVKRFDAL